MADGPDQSDRARDLTEEQRSARIRDKIAGFGVTFTTMFTRTVTVNYPDVKEPTQPRWHGRHQLNRHPDGLEKCVGCELCAWACPGERYGRVYQINYLRCILCGLCIEACPTRALTMTNEYELAGPSRAGLIYEKTDLLGPLLPGMVEAPHPMVAGTTEKDYYRGHVTEATAEQRAWVETRRGADAAQPGAAEADSS